MTYHTTTSQPKPRPQVACNGMCKRIFVPPKLWIFLFLFLAKRVWIYMLCCFLQELVCKLFSLQQIVSFIKLCIEKILIHMALRFSYISFLQQKAYLLIDVIFIIITLQKTTLLRKSSFTCWSYYNDPDLFLSLLLFFQRNCFVFAKLSMPTK